MMKNWLKKLIVPAVFVLTIGLLAGAVAFDFERTLRFADLPPQALENVQVILYPHYGDTAKIELDGQQKARLLDALDELETHGIRLQDFPLSPEEKGYTIEITGGADAYLTMAPGRSRKYMLEGGWFKHRLNDTMELDQLVYRLVEEANKG